MVRARPACRHLAGLAELPLLNNNEEYVAAGDPTAVIVPSTWSLPETLDSSEWANADLVR